MQEAEARAKALKFRIYPNSSLNIKPGELLNAMQNSTLEMAVYPLVYAVGKVREFSLAGLRGFVPNLEAAQALKGSEIYTTLQSIAEANGIRILTWWWAPGGFLAKNREISDPKSVQGLKMRAAEPLFELMLKDAGASVTNMPSTEIYAAMQSGSLDAILTTYQTFVSLSDLYFDAGQRDVERRMVTTLRSAGVSIRRMTNEDHLTWLQLAQRTAWLEYTKINPRAQELLLTTIRTHLEKLGSKDDVVDSIYGDQPK